MLFRSRLALVATAIPMTVNDAFLAAARDDSPAAFEMETAWGHARQSLLSQSPVPGISLAGASRQLNGRALTGVQHADLRACNAYQPAAERIRALDIPALVIGGARDQMTGPRAGEALARQIPGAKFLLLDAGHSVMSEAPRPTLEALARFLAEPVTLNRGAHTG